MYDPCVSGVGWGCRRTLCWVCQTTTSSKPSRPCSPVRRPPRRFSPNGAISHIRPPRRRQAGGGEGAAAPEAPATGSSTSICLRTCLSPCSASSEMTYAFGDTDLAARRLALLAETFAESSRAFMREAAGGRLRMAADLGCGPGYSTPPAGRHPGAGPHGRPGQLRQLPGPRAGDRFRQGVVPPPRHHDRPLPLRPIRPAIQPVRADPPAVPRGRGRPVGQAARRRRAPSDGGGRVRRHDPPGVHLVPGYPAGDAHGAGQLPLHRPRARRNPRLGLAEAAVQRRAGRRHPRKAARQRCST